MTLMTPMTLMMRILLRTTTTTKQPLLQTTALRITTAIRAILAARTISLWIRTHVTAASVRCADKCYSELLDFLLVRALDQGHCTGPRCRYRSFQSRQLSRATRPQAPNPAVPGAIKFEYSARSG